jgi:VanZ family protein
MTDNPTSIPTPVARTRGCRACRWLLALLLGAGCLLLFVGSQPANAPSWLREVWDLGHVALFAGLAWALLQRWRMPLRHLPRLLAGALLLGFAVELIQRYIGRDFSLHDVLLDMVGALFGAVLALRSRLTARQHWLLAPLLLAALLAAAAPLGLVVWSSVQVQRQFPALATFASSLELRRFQLYGGTTGEIRDGALRLRFGTAEWSGFQMSEPPPDWRGYRELVIELDNPEPRPLTLNCRIDDALHAANGLAFHDRFNRRFELAPGAQQLRIPLVEVAQAPRDRAMAMDRIAALYCFVHRQPEPRTLLLRALRLE